VLLRCCWRLLGLMLLQQVPDHLVLSAAACPPAHLQKRHAQNSSKLATAGSLALHGSTSYPDVAIAAAAAAQMPHDSALTAVRIAQAHAQ
jgi:hypothetical protein